MLELGSVAEFYGGRGGNRIFGRFLHPPEEPQDVSLLSEIILLLTFLIFLILIFHRVQYLKLD